MFGERKGEMTMTLIKKKLMFFVFFLFVFCCCFCFVLFRKKKVGCTPPILQSSVLYSIVLYSHIQPHCVCVEQGVWGRRGVVVWCCWVWQSETKTRLFSMSILSPHVDRGGRQRVKIKMKQYDLILSLL